MAGLPASGGAAFGGVGWGNPGHGGSGIGNSEGSAVGMLMAEGNPLGRPLGRGIENGGGALAAAPASGAPELGGSGRVGARAGGRWLVAVA